SGVGLRPLRSQTRCFSTSSESSGRRSTSAILCFALSFLSFSFCRLLFSRLYSSIIACVAATSAFFSSPSSSLDSFPRFSPDTREEEGGVEEEEGAGGGGGGGGRGGGGGGGGGRGRGGGGKGGGKGELRVKWERRRVKRERT